MRPYLRPCWRILRPFSDFASLFASLLVWLYKADNSEKGQNRDARDAKSAKFPFLGEREKKERKKREKREKEGYFRDFASLASLASLPMLFFREKRSKIENQKTMNQPILTTDPRNLDLCRKHLNAAPDATEYGYRLLAMRFVVRLFRSSPPSRDLPLSQHLRFRAYRMWLNSHRKKCRRLAKNPKYKSRARRKRDASWLLYIRWCLRTGTPINWPTVEMVWDKELGRVVGVKVYPKESL